MQRRGAAQPRLERECLGALERGELDAVTEGRGADPTELGELALVARHDQLAAAAMRDAVLEAEGVEELPPGDAQAGLERAARVVDPGMDDLAVARAHPAAEALRGLEDQHFAPALRERACDGEAHDAGADDGHVHPFHGSSLTGARTMAARDGSEPGASSQLSRYRG